jgi:DNA replication protein DnaC
MRVERDGVSGVARCDCRKTGRSGRLLEEARIPPRYSHCELEGYALLKELRTDSLEKAKFIAERFVEEYPTKYGLLFMGPSGIGKTHLAVSIIKRLMMEKSVPCMFRTFPDLLKEIQMSYSPVSMSSELSLLQPIFDAEVLLLDELGAQKRSDWVLDTVAYVLNYRYTENKITILTTNYLDQENLESARRSMHDSLIDRIGAPMRSRLFEMCKTVVMSGEDFRRKYGPRGHHN